MKIKELLHKYRNALSLVYPTVEESRAWAYMLMEHLYGFSKTDLILLADDDIEIDLLLLEQQISWIIENRPIQYITNKCDFMGVRFHVDSGVLIPRQETEQLVDLISRESKYDSHILDIGTGSGVIAVSLAKMLPESIVTAYDISQRALKIAHKNSVSICDDRVRFKCVDILGVDILEDCFDVIASNPPYICNSEKVMMRDNVLNFEPYLALFVSDDDPLLFYRKISKLAICGLKEGGVLYFEINEVYSIEIKNMMEGLGFIDVMIISDVFDKPRIIKGIKG